MPDWLDAMGAGMDAADGWPPVVTVDAPPMQTVGAVLDAAAALGAEVVDREPMPRPGAPAPTMPADPSKWNGSRPPMTSHLAFERAIAYANGERPALTVLPGGRPPADAASEAAALDRLLDAADDARDALARRRQDRARPALALIGADDAADRPP